MARLGDICEVLNGFAFCSGQYVGEGFRIIRISNVQKGYIEDSAPVFYPLDSEEAKKYALKENDLLISLTGNVGRVGMLSSDLLPATLNQRVACIRIKNQSQLTKPYLFNFLNSEYFETKCIESSKGVAQKNMSTEWLKDYEILLPPLEEQRRIAALLDKVSDLIAKRRAQLDKLDLLIKARFVEMFGNFIYERNRWEICDVGTVADIIDPQPSHRTPPISKDGIPYIGVTECDYETLHIDFEKARKVGQDVLKEHLARYTVDEGDFIIGKIGTIGKPFLVPVEQNYTLSANTVLIKPMKGKVNSQFLFSLFQSEYMDRIIDEEKKSTSQPAFGIQKIRKIEIPLPPLKLQEDFAFLVGQVNQSKMTIRQSLDKLETLKKALIQQYFE